MTGNIEKLAKTKIVHKTPYMCLSLSKGWKRGQESAGSMKREFLGQILILCHLLKQNDDQ